MNTSFLIMVNQILPIVGQNIRMTLVENVSFF